MTQPVLRTEKLAKTYALGFFRRKVEAVRDVSFSVQPGEIFGLLGPNGAGKTTTIKVLMGLVRASRGQAEIFGRPAGDRRAKEDLGYLPESPYFYDYLSGREFLVLVGQLCGLARRQSGRRADELIERVGLGQAGNLALRRYSKGMLQRIGLAQALVHEPKLVVLDEPLSGLDPIGRKQLRELIAGLKAEGRTVVLSSHIMSDVEMLVDRVTIVVRGRTVATGRLEELVNARVLSTEVLVAAPSPELVTTLEQAGHAPQVIGETLHIVLDGEQPVDDVIDLIRAQKGRILSIVPRKESLEDVVVREALAPAAQEEGEKKKTEKKKTEEKNEANRESEEKSA